MGPYVGLSERLMEAVEKVTEEVLFKAAADLHAAVG